MKIKSRQEKIHSRPSLSRLRLAAAGTLFLAAAGLAATAMHPPQLPWAVPTVMVGKFPQGSFTTGVAVDQATNTLYVANGVAGDTVSHNTIAVIDGSKCNASHASLCSPVARMTHVGPGQFWLTFDPVSRTLYVTSGLTRNYAENNTVTVFDTKTCNSGNTSGCDQMPAATVTTPGPLFNNDNGNLATMALETSTHTLYVGDAHEGLVSMIDTATCNATDIHGCSHIPTTMSHGDAITIDSSNHSVYVTNFDHASISLFDATTCNSVDQSGCDRQKRFAVPYGPLISAVDETTHTLYVPMVPPTETLGYVGLVDISACNSMNRSGCGATAPYLVHVGNLPFQVLLDQATRTAYTESASSSSISVINATTCNAQDHSGCPRIAPILAVGVDPAINMEIDSKTHSLYTASQDTNTVWVFDTSTCNATDTSGCTRVEPTTTVGPAPVGVAVNGDTQTLYVVNQEDSTVSVIDATQCNDHHRAGCHGTWPTTTVGTTPRFVGVNRVTNTIYVTNLNDNTVSVINGATCNAQKTFGCEHRHATTPVGTFPQQVVVDEVTDTIYVVNQGDGITSSTVSVINGAVCNSSDTSGCKQVWPTITVGISPQALAFNRNTRTLYVANTNDNTVSVINARHCNATDTSHCGQTPTTIPVGNGPRSIGIVHDTNTVFVGNRNDLTVSVINGNTCNGAETSGCGRMPRAILVGAFPSTAGNGNNILGRSIAVDQKKRIVYIPNIGDSDVVTLNGSACRAGDVDDCHPEIVPGRMGGFPVDATVDEATGTVYVTNDTDGTVSLFPSSL